MALRKTGTMLTVLGIILGTGVVGFMLWTSERYRAATPLVFILGLLLLFIPPLRQLHGFQGIGELWRLRRAQAVARTRVADEKRLWRWHIPQLVANLYFTHIQQYPEWIRESRDYVPSSVTNAGRTAEGEVQVLLYYAQYTFAFKMFAIATTEQRQGILEVNREGRRVLTLRVLQSITKRGLTRWVPVEIETFEIHEEWIREFRNLKAEILAIIKNREREARES